MSDKGLLSKTERALEALGEGMSSSPSAPPRKKTPPPPERRGTGRDMSAGNLSALGKQLRTKILAAEKAGNAAMATKLRKQLAKLLTSK